VKTITLNRTEIATIRDHAERQFRRDGGRGRLRMEIGERCAWDGRSLVETRSINIFALTEDRSAEWGGTDLFTQREWSDIRRPIPLASDGRAMVDFYLSSVGEWGELVCNVQAEMDTAGLVAVLDGRRVLWSRDGSYQPYAEPVAQADAESDAEPVDSMTAQDHRVGLTPRKPYRIWVWCTCGWSHMVVHRNALARTSMARGVRNAHIKRVTQTTGVHHAAS
jgi:hypothetical protein